MQCAQKQTIMPEDRAETTLDTFNKVAYNSQHNTRELKDI